MRLKVLGLILVVQGLLGLIQVVQGLLRLIQVVLGLLGLIQVVLGLQGLPKALELVLERQRSVRWLEQEQQQPPFCDYVSCVSYMYNAKSNAYSFYEGRTLPSAYVPLNPYSQDDKHDD